MKKMKALIVEDERMAQAQLTRLLESRFPDIEVVAATGSVHDTVAYLAADPPIDVIFMDVELADGECFEIFRQVPVRAQVIMTTAYDTYAVKAFEAGSIDYLLKPIGEEALARAVGRCRERIAQQAAAANAASVSTANMQYLGHFMLTAYCPCAQCCGRANAPTASGVMPTPNHTVAMGGIPFGTKLMINGTIYTVEDRGTGYGHVDIFMLSHSACLQFGLRYADVYLVG